MALGMLEVKGADAVKPIFELAQLAELRSSRDVRGLLDLRQHQPRLIEEQSTGFAERHASIGALEQTRPQFLLKCLNLLAEGRLRDPEGFSGAPEMQLFSHRDEVAQMA